MAKTCYHSELVKKSPVKIKVVSDVLDSTYRDKPPYVKLEIDGEERTYNTENESCEKFFQGRKGQTISISAEGSRDDARIILVGEEVGSRSRQQQHQPNPPREYDSNPPSRPGGPSPSAQAPAGAGMRAGEIRYERTVGLPNYCSEKIGITVFLEEGAKAAEALAYAKKFVEAHLQSPSTAKRG